MAGKPEKLITKAELLKKLRGIPESAKKKVACALIGHSLIVDGFFGEVYCGRCTVKIADQLTSGFYGAEKSVRIGHNCKTCRKNFKALDWRHKFLVPSPFKKQKLACASEKGK